MLRISPRRTKNALCVLDYKTLCHHSLCFLLTLHHTGNDFCNCRSPLLTIANIKIRFSYKMKNDTPFMTEPCKSIQLPKRCKSITANGINYISTLQNRYKCTKTSSTVNVIPPNLLTSEKHLCCLIIQ